MSKNTAVQNGIIHARVSTTWQALNGTSSDDQLRGLKLWATANEVRITFTILEDGTSGSLYRSRADLQRGLEMIERGEATFYVVHTVDRSARDLDVLRMIRNRVLRAGGRFVANGLEYPDTPEADVQFNLLGTFAEYERKTIRRRTMNGKTNRALVDGQQPFRTFSPYGFHVVTKEDVLLGRYPAEQLGTYQLVEGQWQIVQQILLRYAAGESMYSIQKWLYAEKVESPEGKARWAVSTIRRLISHPAMKGEPAVGRTRRGVDESRTERGLKRIDFSIPQDESKWIKLTCPPLVSQEVWDVCQKRLTENQAAKGGNRKRRYQLGGLVACPRCSPDRICGGNKARRDERYRYYSCPKCNFNIPIWGVQERVRRSVHELATNRDLSVSALRAFQARRKSDDPSATLRRLREQLADTEGQEEKAVELQIAAAMKGRPTGAYERKIEELSQRCAELRGEIATLECRGVPSENPQSAGEMIAEVMRAAAEVLGSPHLEDWEVNEVLSSVVEKVKPTADGEEVMVRLRPFVCAERR